MDNNMKYYNQLTTPPAEAVKPISGGNLKGKSDINPQWKIEAMTATFGPCGIGWKFNITDEKTFQCGDGQILLFLTVALMYHDGECWSEPVYGCGGDFIIEKNKNGLVPNDEAYKMCLTDALGNAMKCIGVAGDVYRGFWDSKYGRSNRTQEQTSTSKAQAQATGDKFVRITPQGVVMVAMSDGKNESGQQMVKYKDIHELTIDELEKMAKTPQYKLAHQAIKNLLAEIAPQEKAS